MQKYCVRYFYVIIAIPIVLLLMLWLIKRTWVKFNNKIEKEKFLKEVKLDRILVYFLRSLSVILLMIAIASPFLLENKTIQGNPRLTILIDNSSSMAMYNSDLGDTLYSQLEGAIPLTVRTIASGEESTIGNGILNHIEGDDNVLVITDGVNNHGKLLGDIMLFAKDINSSVSTLAMEPQRSDVGVTIEGPQELIKDTEGDYVVKVNVVGGSVPYKLQIIEGESTLIREESGSDSQTFKFSRKFGAGEYHKLRAQLLDVGSNDYFKQNNEFFKSVKIVPRPKVLFVSEKNSPLISDFNKLYDMDVRNSIPNDLDEYLGIVINDINAGKLRPAMDRLSEYTTDGGGLIFIGGQNSFERGGYKGSLVETLLPIKIGAGEDENKSDVNIVVVIDISSGTEDYIAIEKALALSVIDSLDENNNVGAVAFGYAPCTAFAITEGITILADIKDNLKKKIAALKFDGQSCFDTGIAGGAEMLKSVGGSKNIIFVSDGKTTFQGLREKTLDVVRNVNAKGVKVFVVGVGTDSDSLSTDNNLFLANIATLGEGIYFKADATNKLKVQFGEKDGGESEEYYNTLIPIDNTHFITLGLEDLDVTVSGYNYAVPKPAARALVTTHKNIPIVVVWRFGLGRVVTITTDDGSRWGGELLNAQNSKLITRSINWAIGDLSRSKTYDVVIRDTVMGKQTAVNVITKEMPSYSDMKFAKIDTNLYSSTYNPDGPGFKEILGASFAVNYNDEYANLGVTKEFTDLVEATGGKVFNPDDIDAIIEFVKQKSKRIKVSSVDYRWPFAIAAMIVFLIEIFVRRLREGARE